mgnify:CR=1 FL=1
MAEQHGKTLVPQIRFAGFTDPWEQRKLSDLTDRVSIQSSDSDLPQVEYEDIIPGEGTLNKDLRDKKGGKTGIKFYAGDVLYGKLRPYLMNWLYPQFNGVAVGDFWVLRATECDSSFLYRLVQTGSFQRLANVSSGSKMPRADWNLISQSFFAVPADHAEQKAIAKGLAELDTLITLHQRKYDKLCVLKKSMLDKMFPKGGSLYPEIRFAGFTDPWEQRKLGELTEIKDSARIPNRLWREAGVPYIRASDISQEDLRGALFIDEEDYAAYKAATGAPEKGDVLFNGGGEIGKAIINGNSSPIYVQGGAVLYARIAHSSLLDARYLVAAFVTQNVVNAIGVLSAGGTMKHFTLQPAKNLPIEVPSIAEQRRIGAFFDRLDSLITLHQRKLELLRNIKKSMLDKMFV